VFRKTRWLLPVLVLSFLCAGCSKSPLDRAQAFLDAGMASDAVPLLRAEIQSNPKNARAHLLLGEVALLTKDREAAGVEFRRVLLLKPGWKDRIARTYTEAAGAFLDPQDFSSASLATEYLEAARGFSPEHDRRLASAFRRAGLRLDTPSLLGTAVRLDSALARDDSVAAALALDPEPDDDARLKAMTRFLSAFPGSPLRPGIFLAAARLELVAGELDSAKAHAAAAQRLASEGETREAAAKLVKTLSESRGFPADWRSRYTHVGTVLSVDFMGNQSGTIDLLTPAGEHVTAMIMYSSCELRELGGGHHEGTALVGCRVGLAGSLGDNADFVAPRRIDIFP
jgi:hypothetical protein